MSVLPSPLPATLLAAAAAGDESEVQRCLAAGVSPRLMGPTRSVLAEALAFGHVGVASLLLAAGADPVARRDNLRGQSGSPTNAWDAALAHACHSMAGYELLKAHAPASIPWPSLAATLPHAPLAKELKSLPSPVSRSLFEQALEALLGREDVREATVVPPVAALWSVAGADVPFQWVAPKVLRAVHENKNEALYEWVVSQMVALPEIEFAPSSGLGLRRAMLLGWNNGWERPVNDWLAAPPIDGLPSSRCVATGTTTQELVQAAFLHMTPSRFEQLWQHVEDKGWTLDGHALLAPAHANAGKLHAAFYLFNQFASPSPGPAMHLRDTLEWLSVLLRSGVPSHITSAHGETLGHRLARSLPRDGSWEWDFVPRSIANKLADTLTRHQFNWSAQDANGVSALEMLRQSLPSWVARHDARALARSLKKSVKPAPRQARPRL